MLSLRCRCRAGVMPRLSESHDYVGHRLEARAALVGAERRCALVPGRVSEFSGRPARLSSRERQILQLVATDKSTASVAAALLLSPGTVDTYRSRLMQTLDIDCFAGLVKFAMSNGLTP
jgi:DNA-binding NarL/FixJ family response regulator